MERELEKQSFCDFSIEEMSDYFRHGQSENNVATEREKCPKNGTLFRGAGDFTWFRGFASSRNRLKSRDYI